MPDETMTTLEEVLRAVLRDVNMVDVAGQLLQQGVEHLLTALACFEQAGEIKDLREDMRSYALSMVALLLPAVEAAGTMAHERAEALEKQETETEDA